MPGLLISAHASAQGPVLRPPVEAACVSSPFGPRRAVGPHAPAGFHNGIDLPAPAGGVVRTGVTYGTHLFFAVLHDGAAVDPAPLLGVAPCRR